MKEGRLDFGSPWPDDLRELGWCVAIHNDYRLNDKPYTFWLFTKAMSKVATSTCGSFISGEAETDQGALDCVRHMLKRMFPKKWDEQGMLIEKKEKT